MMRTVLLAVAAALLLAACQHDSPEANLTMAASNSTSSSSRGQVRVPAHTNRLSHEKSPYLLQHAHNPVDWFPWGEDAFAKARAEDKPIFLSIGYSTCHWCHVMERESFENDGVAAILNREFR